MTILGIYRERVFSPGKILADAAILDATLLELSRKGYESYTLQSEAIELYSALPDCVLGMAQSEKTLGILEDWHKHGTVIINSVRSIRNCYRKSLINLLHGAGLPIPKSRSVPITALDPDKIIFRTSGGYWLKRGDVHAMQSDDVVNVTSTEGLVTALGHFRDRRVKDIVIQEHVEGQVIKFYGVGPGDFFGAFSVSTGEKMAHTETNCSFPIKQLDLIVKKAAEATGLTVYGGDAILSPQGTFVLIDFNDWPSFSPCCQHAAGSIATYISRMIDGGFYELSNSC